MSEETELLIAPDLYEENAVNIGTQQKSADMQRFIERVREDGLYMLDVNMTDHRIRSIAAMLNTYDPLQSWSSLLVNMDNDPLECLPKQLEHTPQLDDLSLGRSPTHRFVHMSNQIFCLSLTLQLTNKR